MSLTSYRAALPRANASCHPDRYVLGCIVERYFVFFTRFGGDLLSHVLRRSTIGAAALNGRVRDGIGCFARAMTTKPRKEHKQSVQVCICPVKSGFYWIKSSQSSN